MGNERRRKTTDEMDRQEMLEQIDYFLSFLDEDGVRRVLDATIQIHAHAGYVGDDYEENTDSSER